MRIVKALKITSLIGFIAFSSPASALPDFDIPYFGAEISNSVDKMKEWVEKSGVKEKAMSLAGKLSELEVDGTNNAFANLMARAGRRVTNIEGKELAEKTSPSQFLCGSVSTSISLGNSGCEEQEEIVVRSISSVESRGTFQQSKKLAAKKADVLVKKIKDGHSDLFSGPNDTNLNEEYKPLSLDPSYLMSSSKALMNLSKEEYEASTNFIELIIPGIKFNNRNADDLSDRDLLEISEVEIPMLLAKSIFENILIQRTPQTSSGTGDNQISKMSAYQQVMDDFNNPNAVEAIGNGNTTTPTQLIRDQVYKKVVKARLQLDQFKSSLTSESVESAILLQLLKKG
jgi:hypothetical protein